MLWFDVGIKRYTTLELTSISIRALWFDVGIKRYTTKERMSGKEIGCGLM